VTNLCGSCMGGQKLEDPQHAIICPSADDVATSEEPAVEQSRGTRASPDGAPLPLVGRQPATGTELDPSKLLLQVGLRCNLPVSDGKLHDMASIKGTFPMSVFQLRPVALPIYSQWTEALLSFLTGVPGQ
jgi:hypothetical protein